MEHHSIVRRVAEDLTAGRPAEGPAAGTARELLREIESLELIADELSAPAWGDSVDLAGPSSQVIESPVLGNGKVNRVRDT